MQNAAPQVAGLKVVVIEGEDAVNIIQQKTAVAPVVEVRDRNDQPVAGAIVRFAIQGGRASFNGARTLTVTTNVAGRAAVSGLTPTSSGAFQITASAAFQGQTAAATIAQTNVLTAAQAASAAASGAGGAGSGAGSAAGGGAGGGGISAATIGVVGGAVAGGTLVTLQAVGASEAAQYRGTFDVETVMTITNRRNGSIVGNCFWRIAIAGTMTADLGGDPNGTLEGEVSTTWTETEVSRTCSAPQPPLVLSDPWVLDLAGSAANLRSSGTFNGPGSNGGTVTRTLAFTGGLSGEVLTGSVTLSFASAGVAPNGDDVSQSYPPTSASIALPKQ